MYLTALFGRRMTGYDGGKEGEVERERERERRVIT
jgi:hypothetical protein